MTELKAPDGQTKNRDPAAKGRSLGLPQADSVLRLARQPRPQSSVNFISRLRLAAYALGSDIARMVQEEAHHGGDVLFAPVYMGTGAIVWFELDFDPPLAGISAKFLILLVALVLKREAGSLVRHVLLAGTLVLSGMLPAQWETWRVGTIMLDTP